MTLRRWAVGIGIFAVWLGLLVWAIRSGDERRARQDLDAYARGYAQGLAEQPAPVSIGCAPEAPLPPELSALAECRATLADYRRTEAANRVNAREWGWNDGYAQGRADWRVQPECPR